MKHLKLLSIMLILTVAALVACSESEQPVVSQDEQQTQPGETAQQQPPPDETAQQQPPAGDTAQQQPQYGDTAQPQSGDMTQQQTSPGDTTAQQQTTEQQPGDMAQQQGQQSTEAGEQVEIAGTVEQTGDGMVIKSTDESYNVRGQDLSQMVGKDVRVRGSLTEVDGKPTIEVSEVDIIG